MSENKIAYHKICRPWLIALLTACFATAALAQESQPVKPLDFNKLRKDFYQAYKSYDHPKALAILNKMLEQKPEDIDTLYNLACVSCLMNQKEKAYTWLEKALKAGYQDLNRLTNDDDFKTIRGEDRFRKLVRQLREARFMPASAPATKPAIPEKPTRPTEEEKASSATKPAPKTMTERQKTQKILEMTQQLITLSKDKKYEAALKVALEAREFADIGLTNYNVACIYSLVDNKDQAFKHLLRAIEQGGFSADLPAQMESDSDLNNLRHDPRYPAALEKARGGPAKPSAQEDSPASGFKWKVTLPEMFDKNRKAPLLVALHATGGNLNGATETWSKAAAQVGAILLTPQGTKQIGPNQFNWGDDVDAVEANLMNAINKAMDEYKVDEDRIILAGFDQGGWAAWLVGLRNADAFRGLIIIGHECPWPEATDYDASEVARLNVVLMIGGDDRETIREGANQAAAKLRELKARVKLDTYEGVGHDFPPNAAQEQIKALQYILE